MPERSASQHTAAGASSSEQPGAQHPSDGGLGPEQPGAARRASGRPPLGPQARRILPLLGALSLVRTLGMIAFATGLGALIAALAVDGFAAQAAQGTTSSQGLAEFIGTGLVRIDGLLPGAWLGDGPWWSWPGLWFAALGATLRALAQWGTAVAARRGAAGTISQIRSRLILRLLESGSSTTGSEAPSAGPEDHAGAAAVLVSRGLGALDDYYVRAVTAMVATGAAPAVLWLWILLHDGVSALIVALTLPLVPVFMILIGRTTQDQTRRAQDAQLRLSRHIVELARGLPVLVGLRRDRAQARALADLDDEHRRSTMQTLRSAFLSSLALELITTLSVALVAVFIGVRLVEGGMGLDTAVMVLLLAPECYQPLRDVGTAYHQSQEGVEALRRSERLLSSPPGEPATERASAAERPESAGTAAVATEGQPAQLLVEGLRVRHDGRAETIGPLDLSASAGRITTLSGPSGAGKTTVVSAIAGLIPRAPRRGTDQRDRSGSGAEPGHQDPAAAGVIDGRIVLPGPVRLVPQAPAFVAGTALDEIALCLAPEHAAAFLEAQPTIPSRGAQPEPGSSEHALTEGPSGPSVLAGRTRAASLLAGVGLSGLEQLAPEALSAGQARRLAVARCMASVEALERTSPGETVTVLVDEPTAHLDQDAAGMITAGLRGMARAGAIVVVVTHDEGLIGDADHRLELTARGARVLPDSDRRPSCSGPHENADPVETDAVQRGHAAEADAPGEQPDDRGQRLPGPFATVRTVLRLSGISWSRAVLSAALAVAAIGFGAALTALSGWLIVRAAQQPGMMYLLVAVTGVRFFGLGRAVLRYLERLMSHDVALRAAGRLRLGAWEATGRTALGLRAMLTGEVFLDRLITRIEDLRDALPRILLPLAALGPVLAGAVVVCLLTVPQAVAPVAGAAVLSAAAGPTLLRGLDARAEARQHEAAAAALRLSSRALQAAPDLRVAQLGAAVGAAVRAQDDRGRRAAQRAAWVSGLGEGLAVLIWFAAAIAVVPLAWGPVASGEVSAAVAAIPVLLCTAMVEPVAQGFEAARQWPHFAALVRAVGRTQPAAHPARPEETDEPGARDGIVDGFERLEVEGLSARWPGMHRDAFSRLSGQIRPGRWWGITGPSGSGKSTALAVLLGFLPPSSGTIRLDGQPMPSQRLRGVSAWCPQDAYIFDSTLRGNLSLARERAEAPTDAQMLEALERVGLGGFAAGLPEGLETQVGAGGQRLSGGQRQRLAVARAMLTRSPVLLLDEPTAHLDALTARQVMAALHEGAHAADAQGVVIISHRPEDVRRCDALTRLS